MDPFEKLKEERELNDRLAEILKKRSAHQQLFFLLIVPIILVSIVGILFIGSLIGIGVAKSSAKVTHAYLSDTNGDGVSDIVIVHSGGNKTVLLGKKGGEKYLRTEDVTKEVLDRFK